MIELLDEVRIAIFDDFELLLLTESASQTQTRAICEEICQRLVSLNSYDQFNVQSHREINNHFNCKNFDHYFNSKEDRIDSSRNSKSRNSEDQTTIERVARTSSLKRDFRNVQNQEEVNSHLLVCFACFIDFLCSKTLEN